MLPKHLHLFQLIAILTLLILTFLSAAGCSAESIDARSFSIDSYQVTVNLASDGSGEVSETLILAMENRRKTFDFDIDYASAGSITFTGVDVAATVTTESPQYNAIQSSTANSMSDSSASYEVQDDGSTLHVRVNVLSEAGSTRTIRLNYRLSRLVQRNSDNAVMVREFFVLYKTNPVSQAELTINLPGTATERETWAMPVTLADFTLTRPQADQLALTASPTTDRQDMTLYCLLPVELFAQAPGSSKDLTWDELTAEARKADTALSVQSNTRSVVFVLTHFFLAVSLLLILIIYWFYDREGAATFRHHFWYSLPADGLPALMALMSGRSRPGRMMLATLLDLVRRGELIMHGNVFTRARPEDQEFSGYAAYEIFLVQWLFDRMAADGMISAAEVRRYARDKAEAGELQIFYTQFRRLIDEELERRGLIDFPRIRRGRKIAAIASLGYLALTVVLMVLINDPFSLLLLLPSAVLGFYAWKIKRLTTAGREQLAVTKALLRTICQASRLPASEEPAFFREMLPLSVAINVEQRLLKGLLTAGEQKRDAFADYDMAVYGIGTSLKPWPDQIRILIDDLRVMSSMFAASLLMNAGDQAKPD